MAASKYYQEPIGIEFRDDSSWEICDCGISYFGTGAKELLERLNKISKLIKTCYIYDLTFVCFLISKEIKIEKQVNNLMNKKQIKTIEFDEFKFCDAVEFSSCDIDDWKIELELDEATSIAQTIYIGAKRDLSRDDFYRGACDWPSTRTGFTRKMISKLNLNFLNYKLSQEQYDLYKKLPRGGLAELKKGWENETTKVWAYDIKSSYPFEMVSKQYPAKASKVYKNLPLEIFDKKTKGNGLWVATIEFEHIKAKDYDYYHYNNRKEITVTSIDYQAITEFYDYKIKSVKECMFHIFHCKLWNKLIELILKLFNDKETQPKTSPLYQKAKKSINSIFGLFDQDFLVWKDDLSKQACSTRPMIIGCWVAAYGRYGLARALYKAGPAAIYWDTDSIKSVVPIDKIIEEENKWRAETLNMDSPLGQWQCEARGVPFIGFTTKQYWQNGKLTAAGLNSKYSNKYLKENNIIPYAGMVIPPEYTGVYIIQDGKRIWRQFTICDDISSAQLDGFHKILTTKEI